MDIVYLNGQFLPHDKAAISPDDRGFLFADSVYEVVKWYGGFFFDMEGHATRLHHSLNEIRIVWDSVDDFPSLAEELIHKNDLGSDCAIVYMQVTRGAAPRTHAFPVPPVKPTVYGFARRHSLDTLTFERGTTLTLVPDPRWSRCDIKSTALLANILAYQDAHEKGSSEVCFVREGFITEGAHSNVFLVRNDTVFTHPVSTHILSGITRKNVIELASENGISLIEEAVAADMLPYMTEAFIAGTTVEVTPVLKIGDQQIGNGAPGGITRRLQRLLRERIDLQRERNLTGGIKN